MRICVLGLGYVGTVSAACFAQEGHTVIGVDTVAGKVDLINAGKSTVIEKDLDNIVGHERGRGRLSATTDVASAVLQTDLSLVCVGTPSQPNGDIDLRHIRKVCEQIGAALRHHHGAPVVAVRSTLVPGSMREVVIPALEASSRRRAGIDFGVCLNPEFLREGSAVRDFYNPPRTVIGELNAASGDLLERLYRNIPAPVVRTDIRTAEMVKYADNAWHALKVGFANEIGNFAKAMGVDAHRLMEIFCLDTKLNLSASYLKPGFAFGGSCLPKDLRALLYKAKSRDLALPIIGSILPSNQLQIERGIQAVIDQGCSRIGVLGISFKEGSDDLRESPVVELVERLIGRGYDVRIYDDNVRLASIHGANRDYILNRIPHISRLLVSSIDEVMEHAQTLVVGNAAPEFRDIPRRLRDGQSIVDLVRIVDANSIAGVYEGICW